MALGCGHTRVSCKFLYSYDIAEGFHDQIHHPLILFTAIISYCTWQHLLQSKALKTRTRSWCSLCSLLDWVLVLFVGTPLRQHHARPYVRCHKALAFLGELLVRNEDSFESKAKKMRTRSWCSSCSLLDWILVLFVGTPWSSLYLMAMSRCRNALAFLRELLLVRYEDSSHLVVETTTVLNTCSHPVFNSAFPSS